MEKVKEKEFYHIHDNIVTPSSLWEVEKEFEIDDSYDSSFGQELKRVSLEEARLFGDAVAKREIALEELRMVYYPEEISRFHCIWLCDANSLDYWMKILAGKVYRVKVTGSIFRSSDNLLYTKNKSFHEIKYRNSEYWKGHLVTREDIEKSEYLFQGKVKVLERWDKNEFL